MVLKHACLLLALAPMTVVAGATVITVGSGLDAETIDDALAMAADGDELAIASGTWFASAAGEPVAMLLDRTLVLRALDSGDPPVLNGGSSGRAFVIDGGTITLEDLVLRGGAIAGGDIDGDGSTDDWERSGGAITMREASVTMRRVDIESGQALHGGGAAAWTCNLVLEDVDVRGTTASFFGGGLRVHEGSLSWASGSMDGCAGDTGGGLVAGGGAQVSLTGVTMSACQATYYGGAMCFDSSQSEVNTLLTGVTIDGCSAGQSGGGIYAYGGVLQASDLEVRQCTASNGAGVDAVDAVLGIDGGTLRDNAAADEGGGVRVVDGSALLEHLSVTGNAGLYGAGVLLDWCDSAMLLDVSLSGNDAVLRGGGMYASGAFDVAVSACSVSNNTANLGAGGLEFASSCAGLISDSAFCGQSVHVAGTWQDNGGNEFENSCSGASCPGDVDGSGEVGPQDLIDLIEVWGSGQGAADCDGDGLVGVLDLILVLKRWGTTC